ncbi:MAG: DUF1622 domain-containing protein [Gemmatimonadaceae bacterium]
MSQLSTVVLADALAQGIELVGIAIMILGGVAAMVAFLSRSIRTRRHQGESISESPLALGAANPEARGRGLPGSFERSYNDLRADLGRAILLGLEFLVAADIIGTVAIEPTFRSLGVLALIVAIRTFLSFSLELEISGRWPWQQSPTAVSRQPAG